jgi:class 3 adenylate cyclase
VSRRGRASERAQRRLAAILAADVVGYSRLVGIDEALKALRKSLTDPTVRLRALSSVALLLT